ncbi:MAG: hypothetical protein RIK87_07780 [Fuerstiella sp.]
MSDLNYAVLTLVSLCVAALLAGVRVGLQRSARDVVRAQIIATLLIVGYLTLLWNRPILTRILPTPSLIILSNWLPIWAAFVVGIYLTYRGIPTARRYLLASLAVSLCVYSTVAPLTGRRPVCDESVADNAALQFQSTPYTCSSACAASVLRLHGIQATESEMAELCLTRQGTHWMGLYRGMKLKTAGTPWDVAVESIDINHLLKTKPTPCVLSVNVDTSLFARDIDHGFHSGFGHSVVYLGNTNDRLLTVFDPSPDFGVEDWGDRLLRCIDGGVVVRLVPRNPDSPETLRVTRHLASTLLNHRLALRF